MFNSAGSKIPRFVDERAASRFRAVDGGGWASSTVDVVAGGGIGHPEREGHDEVVVVETAEVLVETQVIVRRSGCAVLRASEAPRDVVGQYLKMKQANGSLQLTKHPLFYCH